MAEHENDAPRQFGFFSFTSENPFLKDRSVINSLFACFGLFYEDEGLNV
jgi:hypothetical protein